MHCDSNEPPQPHNLAPYYSDALFVVAPNEYVCVVDGCWMWITATQCCDQNEPPKRTDVHTREICRISTHTHTHDTPQHIHTAHIAPLLTPVDYRTNNQHIIYQYIIMLEIEK